MLAVTHYQIRYFLLSIFHMYPVKNGINVLCILSHDKLHWQKKKKKKKPAYIQENLIRDVSLSMYKHQQEKQYLCLSESFSLKKQKKLIEKKETLKIQKKYVKLFFTNLHKLLLYIIRL